MHYLRCSCNIYNDELLVGATEYRCCREVICAVGKALFDSTSTEKITCITQHEDYEALANTSVLDMADPLLRSPDRRTYIRRAGQTQNE